MKKNDDNQKRLDALLHEMDNVRTGRSIRRRATAGLAAITLVATVVWLALPSGRTAPTIVPHIAQRVDPTPIVEPAPAQPEPSYRSISVVKSSPVSALRHVEIIDDEGLSRALRASGTQGGVARVNGRVILTGSLAEKPVDEPGPAIPSAM